MLDAAVTMDGVFTRLVRAIPARLSPELMDEAWNALAGALRRELRKRGLWTAPPSYLGVVGWDRWDEDGGLTGVGRRRPGAIRGPLDELVADCFTYNFVERLRSLLAQLRDKPQIDALVLLNVRHFVYERQRRHDPVGFRVFEIVREAAELGLRRGVLETAEPGRRIANATVLVVGDRHGPRAEREELARLVTRWNDDLLPDLLVVVGRRRRAVVEQLLAELEALADDGVASFLFKDLIDPLKHDARARWGAFLAQSDPRAVTGGPGSELETASLPDRSWEERQRFEWLAGKVAAAIETIDVDPRRRDYLTRLWTFLAPTGADAAPEPPDDGRRLSARRLGELLGIPRERLPDLMKTLGELLAQVRSHPLTIQPCDSHGPSDA